uniref:G-protein coupled receptors family 1 profile domain-containing protein n=2 Tax=Ciona intestinalis TaxID=7719 RepID=F6Y805_CIOIN
MDEMLNETLNLTSNSSIINNISTSGDVFDDSEVLAYIAAEIIIAVFALFSNLFVFIAIIRFKNLQTPTFCLLASLSVADISVALLAIPSAIVLRIGLGLQISGQTTDTDHPVHQGTVCFPLCLAMVAFQLFATQVSIWGLLLIAIDRFVAIHFHLRYRAYITLYRVKVGIVVSWLGGSVIALGWESAVGASAENLHAVKRCAF